MEPKISDNPEASVARTSKPDIYYVASRKDQLQVSSVRAAWWLVGDPAKITKGLAVPIGFPRDSGRTDKPGLARREGGQTPPCSVEHHPWANPMPAQSVLITTTRAGA
jgi:hypothetical protein